MCCLFLLFLTACTRPASTQAITLPPPPGPAQWMIQIERVQVNTGASIEINGSAILAEGGCIQTELLENGQPVAWWPKDTCIQPDTRGTWQMVAPLGRKGAPPTLDSQSEYEIHARWPDHSEAVQTHFPLDIQPPPKPQN